MADKNGAQEPHSSPGPEEDQSDNPSPGSEKDLSDGERKERDPNYWAAGSFLLNLWRFVRDWLSSENPPSFGPPFL